MTHKDDLPSVFVHNTEEIITELGQETLLKLFQQMILIRQFEIRAESRYQQGKIGGFLHLYIGQEAIQTAAIQAIGQNNWFIASYRCHALAILLGESPQSLMNELFGKKTGNALGRGGSMHMYSDRMLGGFGVVSGQLPIATGAGFTCKYTDKKDEISVCFFGDGAVAQGVVHESFNLASMWNLPCMYVIENNNWSMGTPLKRTLTNYDHFLKDAAVSYNMRYFRLDGMDLTNCYAGFKEAYNHILSEQRPVIIECCTDRFRGHSISDAGLYRSKEDLKKIMERDPITLCKNLLIEHNMLTEGKYKQIEKECREEIAQVAAVADKEPWPDLKELETGVMA